MEAASGDADLIRPGQPSSSDRRLRQAGVTTTVKERRSTSPPASPRSKKVESLGLEIQERRAPLDVLVVDHIERTPT